MTKGNKIVVVSHCILNQNVVVQGWERAIGAFPIAKYLLEQNISFLQLPCPEFLTLGKPRPPMEYQEYADLPGFRENCRLWLQPTIAQLQTYHDYGYDYLGVIGIHHSPNCSITGQRGVLMEEFFDLSEEHGFSTDFFEIPTWYTEENRGEVEKELEKYFILKENNQ